MSVIIVLCCIHTLNTIVATAYMLMFMFCLLCCIKKLLHTLHSNGCCYLQTHLMLTIVSMRSPEYQRGEHVFTPNGLVQEQACFHVVNMFVHLNCPY